MGTWPDGGTGNIIGANPSVPTWGTHCPVPFPVPHPAFCLLIGNVYDVEKFFSVPSCIRDDV